MCWQNVHRQWQTSSPGTLDKTAHVSDNGPLSPSHNSSQLSTSQDRETKQNDYAIPFVVRALSSASHKVSRELIALIFFRDGCSLLFPLQA